MAANKSGGHPKAVGAFSSSPNLYVPVRDQPPLYVGPVLGRFRRQGEYVRMLATGAPGASATALASSEASVSSPSINFAISASVGFT